MVARPLSTATEVTVPRLVPVRVIGVPPAAAGLVLSTELTVGLRLLAA